MKKYLVSIIVPIFNTEKYLDKCILSLINQTYENIEIILINDGSSDNSEKICKQHVKSDNRIKLITQKNSGVAMARNKGLDNVNGDYICFVDADDYVSKDYIKKLLDNALKYNADVVECSYVRVEDSIEKEIVLQEYESTNKYDISKKFIERVMFTNYSCNKIFSKKVLNNIRFKDLKQSEDHEFLSRVYLNCDKKINIVEPLYYYVANNSSITLNGFSKKRLDAIFAEEMVLSTYKKMGYNDIVYYTAFLIIKYVFDFYRKTQMLDKKEAKEIKKELKFIFKKYYKIALKTKVRTGGGNLSTKQKIIRYIQYYMFLIFPNLVSNVTNLKYVKTQKEGKI